MKRMFHKLHGWALAENVTHEQRLMSLGWVEDRPEYSPKFVPVDGPAGVPPPVLLPPQVPVTEDKPKRGRPPKVKD